MPTNTWLRWGIIGGIFVVPFVAFIVPYSMFFPFISGKNFAFRIIVEIIFALWLVLVIRDRRYWPRRSPILLATSVFILVLALADLFGANPYRSFWSNYERMEGLVAHLHLFAYFLVTGSVLGAALRDWRNGALWDRFFQTAIVASSLMLFYALLQLSGIIPTNQSGTRLDGTLGNSAYLAIYFVFHIFLIAYYALRTKQSWLRYGYGVLGVLELIVLFYTATRGAIIGLVLGALVAALIYVFKHPASIMGRRMAYALIGLLLVFGGVFLMLQKTDYVRQHPVLSRFVLNELLGTVKTRSTLWAMAYEGWQERPLLGWGQDNFNLVFNKFYRSSLYAQEQWFDRAHNVFFDWLTTAGLLGLLAYLGLYGITLYELWRLKEEKMPLAGKAVFSGLFVAYFVHNFTVFDNLLSSILFFSVLAYVHSLAIEEGQQSTPAPVKLTPYHQAASAISLVIMLGLLYKLNLPALLANRALLKGLDHRRGAEAQFKSLTQSLAYESFGVAEAREQLIQEAIRELRNPKISESLKGQFIALAETEMQKQIATTPNDARYHVFLGSFYTQIGRHDQAVFELEKAHALSPQKQTILFELGNTYLNQRQYDRAVEYMKKAYDLEPANTQSAYFYAATLIYAGKLAESDRFLTQKFGNSRVFDPILVSAYAANKHYQRLIALWQEQIKKEPTNSQNYVSLAASYLAAGERAKAIEQLQKAISLNPKFREQGEFYIKELKAGRNP